MKKTLLALLVAGAATSANAAVTVYDNGGVSIDVTGAAEVQVYKDYGDSPDTDIRIDDGDLGTVAKLSINEDLYAIGGFGLYFEDDDVGSDEAYVGFGSETYGEFTIGRQLLISDDAGIGKDYEFGTGGVDFVQTEGDETYKYVYDNGTFYFGTSGLVSSDNGTYLNDSNQEIDVTGSTEIYDARVGYRVAGLDARFYYYTGKNIATSLFGEDGDPGVDTDVYSLELEYQLTDAIGLAGSWSNINYESSVDSSQEIEADVYQIAADYQWNNTNFAAGWNFWDETKSSQEIGEIDARTYYVTVTQRVHQFAKVYAEVGYDDDDSLDENVAYLVGMEVAF